MQRKNSKREPRTQTEKKPSSLPNDFGALLETLRSEISLFFKSHRDMAFRPGDIHDAFQAEDKRLRNFINEAVNELTTEGVLTHQADGTYLWNGASNADEQMIGRIDHVNKRFAFAQVDGLPKDLYVKTEDLNGALDGDRVKLSLLSSRNRDRQEAYVTEIVERGKNRLVGKIEVWPKYAVVKPDSRKIYDEIHVHSDGLGDAKSGDKVIVKIEQWPNKTRQAIGVVQSVLGKSGENNTEMHAILAEFGLPVEFPKPVEDEVVKIDEKIPQSEINRRKDFRNVTTFTIDPADAKDFDDALSLKFLENGHVEVGVHIADVSHYVLPDTELEKEAYRRATSVYLVDRTVPMLPEKLSNNLCSLRPNEDRLAFSAVFELDDQANILSQWFGRTIIHSDRRFSYEEAQEVIDKGFGDFMNELILLNTLAKTLRKQRFDNGAINFDTVEVQFKLDPNGTPLGVFPKERKDSHKLIEEFMLLANKQVAGFVNELAKGKEKNVMIYRIHEPPDDDRLATFATFVKRLGYHLKLGSGRQIAASMNAMLAEVEGKPEQHLIEELAVRTMAKARYSTDDIGHFGLAFDHYTHFTSPIRRYPDLLAHRLLQHYLNKGASMNKEELELAAKHSSDRERAAGDAERASIKYKQVEYMSLQPEGKVYDGIISGVTEFGIFVEIPETAGEGLVRMTDLSDDYYDYDAQNFRLVGERSKKMLTFGDSVQVSVKEINLDRRSMDFILAGDSVIQKFDAKPKNKKTPPRIQRRQKSKERHRGRQ